MPDQTMHVPITVSAATWADAELAIQTKMKALCPTMTYRYIGAGVDVAPPQGKLVGPPWFFSCICQFTVRDGTTP